MLGPALLTLSLLFTGVPAASETPEPTPSGSCLEEFKTETSSAELPTGFVGGAPMYRDEVLWRSAGFRYVVCEIEAGGATSLLFLEDLKAAVVLSSGLRLEFPVDPERAGWLAALAVEHGVEVSATERLEIPPPTSDLPTRESTPLAGLIALALSVAVGAGLFVGWRRRKRRNERVVVAATQDQRPGRHRSSDVPDTKFSDVAGCKEAIEDLKEMVEVLRYPERFRAVGARPPKGALLVGPPGTGKTLLARAVAGEAEVPFFAAAGSDFVEMYVGVGARRVRDVFEKAKKAGRAIVFIDEIDAVGRKRADGAVHGGEQEHENTLISLLNELDGFRDSQVVVLAATNRPDVLDAALTRPGRLDRRVHIGLPDVREREEVLKVHTRNKPLEEGVSLTALARRTPGMSGAQLEQVANEAALLAARSGRSKVSQIDLASAVEYVAMGRARRSAVVSESDRLVTAWHEAGHTVAALRVPGAEPPVAVSIVPRGQAGGVTWTAAPDSALLSREQLRARLVVALAGRSAEERLLGGEYTAGAASDLEHATELARMMVTRFGMTSRGLSVRSGISDIASDDAVEALLQEAHDLAKSVLEESSALLDAVVTSLLASDDLSEEDLHRLDTDHPRGC
jgi:cell division protease FtsH